MNINVDNCNVELKDTSEGNAITVEPSFVGYLRSQGYPVNGVSDMQVIPSESDTDKAYVVCKVKTLLFPKGHPELDLVEHQIEIAVCSCWAFRSDSPEISEDTVTPAEVPTCKHLRSAYKEVDAREDDQQQTISGP